MVDSKEVRRMLTSGDSVSKKKAITFLLKHSDTEAGDLLKPLLKDADPEIRTIVRQALKRIYFPLQTGDRKIDVEKFENLMQSPDPIYRTRVIMTARKFKQDELLPYYIANLYEEEDEFVIATLLQAIGEVGDSTVVKSLSRFLKHGSDRVRANAVEALGKVGGEMIPRLITPLLDDSNNRVRICAVRVLWATGDRDVLDKLKWMLKSELPIDRISAAFMLGLIDDPATVPVLIDALDDEDETVRKKVLENLSYKISIIEVKERFLDLMFSDSRTSGTVREALKHLEGKVRCKMCAALNDEKINFCGKCGSALTSGTVTAFNLPSEEEINRRKKDFRKQQLKERALKILASDQERGLQKRSWKRGKDSFPVDDIDIDVI